MKILIIGLSRSGLTALYFKIKAAVPEKTWCLFEPPRFDPSDPGGAPDVLAKILIASPNSFDYPSFRDFDKRIMIVRDPRDNLVSRILFDRAAAKRSVAMRRRSLPSPRRCAARKPIPAAYRCLP